MGLKSIECAIEHMDDKKSLNIRTWEIYLILLVMMLSNTWVFQNYIMTREVYINLMSDQLEISRIDDYFHYVKSLSNWSYLLIPFILVLRLLFVSLLVQFPLVFKFIDVPLKNIFRIAAIAFVPLAVTGMIKNIWLLRLPSHVITEQTLNFTPLALTNLLDIAHYSKATYLVLNNFNLAELLWCLIMIAGLKATGKLKTLDASLLVMIIWTSLFMFQWALISYITRVYS